MIPDNIGLQGNILDEQDEVIFTGKEANSNIDTVFSFTGKATIGSQKECQ